MGVLKTKEDIYNLAYDKIRAEHPAFESAATDTYQPQNKRIDLLDLIIASEMEEFKYPFAIQSVPLRNEVQRVDITTNKDGNKLSSLYVLPEDVASVVGVFREQDIPNLSIILNRTKVLDDVSISYNVRGNEEILVFTESLEADDVIYLVYITNRPKISAMPSLFQSALVFSLAAHIYTVEGRNSNILRLFLSQHTLYRDRFRKYVIENSSDFTQVLPSILDIAYNANKDGQVQNNSENSVYRERIYRGYEP